MTDDHARPAILAKIKRSIDSHGCHITVVGGGPIPRFAYTIGLSERAGFELIIAGAAFFSFDDVLDILNELARRVLSHHDVGSLPGGGDCGDVSVRVVDPSWGRRLLLGAFDYYELEEIDALQVVPDKEHWTIDVPDMTVPWNRTIEPVWQWLENDWPYPVPSGSTAITNLDALRGHSITELMRWKTNEWELYSGSHAEVQQSEIRIVPLGTLLGYDPTLNCIVDLEIGSGLWRDNSRSDWHPMERGEGSPS